MDSQTNSPAMRRTGILISVVVVLFLAFDGVIKIMKIEPVVQSFAELGLPHNLAAVIGILELSCLALFIVPRTALAGAVMLTGFLGGAIVLQLRIEAPLLSHTLFPVYVGLLVWAGLLLREGRFRHLVFGKETV